MNWPNHKQFRHWWNIIHMETDEEKKEKKQKDKTMAHRKPAGSNDSSIFRRTATTVRKINIAPKARRGGTCL